MSNPVAYNSGSKNLNSLNTVFSPQNPVNYHGYDPSVRFNNNNFTNPNTLVHNNLSDIILNEEIREYSVMIDSKDRNYQVYPDPYNYEVKLGPLPRITTQVGDSYEVYEDPAPTINHSFKNVRYIKLAKAILPIFNRVRLYTECQDDNSIVESYKVDVHKPVTNNLYTVLSIGKQFSDISYFSTNDLLSSSFATIYYDSKVNSTHYFGCMANGLKIFPQDQLGQIDRMQVNFMDPYGYPMTCEHVNPDIMSDMICTCEDPEGDEYTDCFKHNLFHPLNPIFQHHLHFKIGVVEPRLNKLTFN